MGANPYSELPDNRFWRSGVATLHPTALKDLYQKKFDILPGDTVATAGSCFAQHISRHMLANGFNFTDFEPGPVKFPESRRADYNYGVFSARFCNIYTVRQLLQLYQRAFGKFEPVEPYWKDENGVVDAFRPRVEPEPFVSVEEYANSLESHLRAVRRMFRKTNVLVFTLGLTEAWIDKRDGSVYPACPGTLGGVFDAEKYEFRNFSFPEIYGDFKKFITEIRKINPGIRFLLTVSPVPLTATASDNHVLVATMGSKSTLRSVAGQLAADIEGVDYFPSYEIIAAPSMGGIFFERNLRSVNASGVECVMRHFFQAHPPAPRTAERPREKGEESTSQDDLVCEEALLDDMRRD